MAKLPPITQVSGTAVHVPGDDIDTDRIIPARFMKCVTFDGLGEYAFIDVRNDPDTGEERDHPLNDPQFAGASILLTGSNFGCGSSREHAPQALYRYGFRAVIAESFAEIFFGNSITLGMPCVVMNTGDIESLAKLVAADPAAPITIDLAERKAHCGDVDFPIVVPDHAHEALVSGKWDAIADLLEGVPDVKKAADSLAYMK